MKKLVLVLVFAGQLLSCNSQKKDEISDGSSEEMDNIESTESVLGQILVYEGTLPCADCEGIETILKINLGNGTIETHTFELTNIYKGKQTDKKFVLKGNYNTERGLENDPDGTVYVLNYDKPETDQLFYGVSAANTDKLFILNNKREKIKSKLNYFLTLNE